MTALAGCGDESFKPPVRGANNAPEVSANIVVEIDEAEMNTPNPSKAVFLLGSRDGERVANGDVFDKDGDVLSVKNLVANTTDLTGFDMQGNTIYVRTSDLNPLVDSGESKTVVFTYDISDGINEVSRTATITFNGLDFEPEISGDSLGNFTRDAVHGSIDLLANATDRDGEVLTASNLVADPSNPFPLNVSINSNHEAVVDIAAVADQIPDGEKVTFKFTYDVQDHRVPVEANLVINIVGFQDIPGTPLIGSYFLTDTVNETDNLKSYDLIDDVIDREGDAISIKNVQLNGSVELPYGVAVDGNNLWLNPTAFLTEIAPGENKILSFTYQIEDANGFTSDGVRSLDITINGVESNIIAAEGGSVTFESDTIGQLPFGWENFGYEGAAPIAVSTEAARTGNNGVTLVPGIGMAIDWTAEKDRIYYYAGWSKTVAPNGFAQLPVHFNVYNEPAGREWWRGGNRQWVADTTVWNESFSIFNTFSFGLGLLVADPAAATPVPNPSFHIFNGPLASHSDVTAYVDDVRIVDITDINAYANNILDNTLSSFEDGLVPTNNGVGVFAVTDSATDVTNGTFALTVDTTGAAGAEFELPVPSGAIKEGGRYMLQLDLQATNAVADTATGFQVKLKTASGEVFNFYPSVWSNNANPAVRVMLNTETASGTPDWENEDVTVSVIFNNGDIIYHVDYLALFAIP